MDSAQLQLKKQEELNETIVSVDESQVSAAERYRMPVELFQPDEESPEKSFKLDDTASKLTVDLPSKLFQESVTSADGVSKSPHHQSRDTGYQAALKEPRWSKGRIKVPPDFAPGIDEHETSMEVDLLTNEDSTSALLEANRSGVGIRDSTNDTAKSSALRLLDESVTEAQRVTEEEQSGTEVPPVKTRRSRGRPKGSTGKRGRKKFHSVSTPRVSTPRVSESAEAMIDVSARAVEPVVSPETSSDITITHPEMQSLQHSPRSSPAKHLKPSSADVSFASDLVLKFDDDDYEEKDTVEEDDKNLVCGAETVQENTAVLFQKRPEQSPQREKIMVIKCSVSGPAFVRHKTEKVSWDGNSCTGTVSRFNYRVLSGKPVTSQSRHLSLGPREECFTSVPPPYSVRRSEISDKPQTLPAVVVRRQQKPLEKPKSDPSKVPTVVPLVMEDNCDPSCIGGSVVTSPDGGEVFAGTVLKQRVEMVDWNTSSDKEEVLENLTGEELRLAQRQYLRHLMTGLYIQAGDFSSLDDDNNDDFQDVEKEVKDEEKEEEVTVEKNGEELAEGLENSTEEKVCDQVGKVDLSVTLDDEELLKKSFSKDRQKRKHSLELASPGQVTKKSRSSQDEQSNSLLQSPSNSALCSDLESADTPITAVSSRINGTDTASSLSHSCQTAEPEPGAQPKEAPTQQRFNSPSRRSSRTPIPSKKVLDAWDDFPARSALKDKRTLSLSSDDELSGYSSGDVQRKKLKTKQFSAS
ncbi:unnamed protein product [Candidula unifasciata]|uniref:Uncharacterized protein n=1 Tax=Candidula unifasciata TaxID=100452 RepID=A0A8S3YHV0_9EUPU|nr:unnamed protein product [Candidula unifasciata]